MTGQKTILAQKQLNIQSGWAIEVNILLVILYLFLCGSLAQLTDNVARIAELFIFYKYI